MKQLFAPTEIQILTELTYLSVVISANDSSATVKNSNGFSENDYIVSGRVGNDQTELEQIGSVTAPSTLNLKSGTQFSFDHKIDAQIQVILFNQRKFYRSDTETGTFTILSGGTVNMEVDRPSGTFFEDSVGTSNHWYKATYYNSTTDVETSLDDAIAVKADESDHYTSIFDIRRQSGFEEAYGISDEMISGYRQEAENEFESRIATVYSTPLTTKPKIGRQIVNLLAAGNLLIKEYGVEADIEISKSGARMLERANELIEKIIDGTLKLTDDSGAQIGAGSLFTASGSNTYNGIKKNKGSVFTLEDEHFHGADPDTGYGTTH